MRNIVMLFVFSSLCMTLFCSDDDDVRKLEKSDVVDAVTEAVYEASEVVSAPKVERKKKKRRFFKRLLVKAAELAINALIGRQKGVEEEVDRRINAPSVLAFISLVLDLDDLFTRASALLEKVKDHASKEEAKQMVREFLEATDRGLGCLESLFTDIRFYVNERLCAIFEAALDGSTQEEPIV